MALYPCRGTYFAPHPMKAVCISCAIKNGTNGLAVRAGRPVTQTTTSSGAVRSTASITGIYIYNSIDSGEVKYKKRNYFKGRTATSFEMSNTEKSGFQGVRIAESA